MRPQQSARAPLFWLLASVVVLLPTPPGVTAQAYLGCDLYCCCVPGCFYYSYYCGYPYYYCCNNYCENFNPTATGNSYWSGCSGKTLYVTGNSAYGDIVNGGQSAAFAQATSSRFLIRSGASVSNVYLQGVSSAVSVYGSATNVYPQAQSTVITVFGGASVNSFPGSSYTTYIRVYGTLSSSSSGGGDTIVYNGGSIGTHYQYSGTTTVNAGGSISNLYGYGTFDIYGSVSTLSTSGSSNVYIRDGAALTTLYLNGASSTVTIDDVYVNNIYVGYSGSSVSMGLSSSNSGFGVLAVTTSVNSFTMTGSSSNNMGCIRFQSSAANVLLSFTGVSFSSSSCHFIHFQGTATTASISVRGSSNTFVTNYAAVKADSTVNNMYVFWDDSRLTITSYDAFRVNSVIGSGLTITINNLYSCTNCNSIIGNNRFKKLDAGTVINIENGNSAGSNVRVTTTSSNLNAYSNNVFRCTGVASSVTISARGSSWYAPYGATVYFSTNIDTLVITSNSNDFESGTHALLVSGSLTSATFRLFDGARWRPDSVGVRVAGTTTNMDVRISDSGSRISSGAQCFSLAGAVTNAVITIMSDTRCESTDSHMIYAASTVAALTVIATKGDALAKFDNLYVAGTSTDVVFQLSVTATMKASGSGYSNFRLLGAASSITLTADNSKCDADGSNMLTLGSLTNAVVQMTSGSVITSRNAHNFQTDGTVQNLLMTVDASEADAEIHNFQAKGNSNNVRMLVTSGSTITAAAGNNWFFASTAQLTNAVSTIQTNVFSMSGGSLAKAELDNFQFDAATAVAISIIGTAMTPSRMIAKNERNVHCSSSLQWFTLTILNSLLQADVLQNVLVVGSIGTVNSPNAILVTSSTITSSKTATSMEFQGPSRTAFTITASASTVWTAGGVGAISMKGASTGDVITIISSTVTVSTAGANPAMIQLNSGTTNTMSSTSISISAVAYTFTAATPLPATAYVSFIRTDDTVLTAPAITVFGCSFTVQANPTHRMELLDMQGATRITGGNVLLAKIPYYSVTSCSTLPKGYGPCAALMRGAIVMASTSGSVSGTTITVQCIEFSTTSLSFIDFQGVVTGAYVRTDSVAIWQSQAVVAFVNLDHASSSGNQIRILQTYIHVPIIVHSEAGAVGVSLGIAADCSFMSQYPMSQGFFEPALVPLVTRLPLNACPKVFAPACWITTSKSQSLTVTISLTNTLSLSGTITLSEELTMSVTHTLSMSVSQQTSGSVSESSMQSNSATLDPTLSRMPSRSKSLVHTLSTTIVIGTFTEDRRQRRSRTLSMSSVASLSPSESAGSRTMANSATLSATHTASPTSSATPSHSIGSVTPSNSSEVTATVTGSGATASEAVTPSGSPSSSASSTATGPTPSHSTTKPPPTATHSPTVTASVSPESLTAAETKTVSPSTSSSEEPSRSRSPSRSASEEHSVTPSASETASPSQSESPTETSSPTTTQSPSSSDSASPSGSVTSSETQALSFTESSSITASNEHTRTLDTASLTAEASKTESVTGVDSLSRSPSDSVSPTASRTVTETDSPSWSVTPTGATLSDHPSTTDSSSGSGSVTPSATSTMTASPDGPTTTVTVSATGEPTLEETLSETETFSATDTWSITGLTPTRKVTRSCTKHTRSAEVSATPTASISAGSATAEVSVEVSQSASTSRDVSFSPSASVDGLSTSDSESASTSGEGTPSPSFEFGSASASTTRRRDTATVVASSTETFSATATSTLLLSASRLVDSKTKQTMTLSPTSSGMVSASQASWTHTGSPPRRRKRHASWSVSTSESQVLASRTETVSGSKDASDSLGSATRTRYVVQAAPPDGGVAPLPPDAGVDTASSMLTLTRSSSVDPVSLSGNRRLSATKMPSRTGDARTKTSTLTISFRTLWLTITATAVSLSLEASHTASLVDAHRSTSASLSSTAAISRQISWTRESATLTMELSMSASKGAASETLNGTVSGATPSDAPSVSPTRSVRGGTASRSVPPSHSPTKQTPTAPRTLSPSSSDSRSYLRHMLLSITESQTDPLTRASLSHTRRRWQQQKDDGSATLTSSTAASASVSHNNGDFSQSQAQLSLTATSTVTGAATVSASSTINASVTATIHVVTDTVSVGVTGSEPSVSQTQTVTLGVSLSPGTETMTAGSASGSDRQSSSVSSDATATVPLRGQGDGAVPGQGGDSVSVTMIVASTSATESASVSTSQAPRLSPNNASSQASLNGSAGGGLRLMGSSPTYGIPGGLLFVNVISFAGALLSSLVFATGLRGRDRKKKTAAAIGEHAAVGSIGGSDGLPPPPTTNEESSLPKERLDKDGGAASKRTDRVNGIVTPLSVTSSDTTPPSCWDRFLDTAPFHVYAGVLMPCSAVCGWVHAAASSVHSNTTILVCVVVGRILNPSSGAAAWGMGMVVAPLVMLLIRLAVERMALRCVNTSVPADSSSGSSSSGSSRISTPKELKDATIGDSALHSPNGLRPASQRSTRTLEELDLRVSRSVDSGTLRDDTTYTFGEDDDPLDVVDLDALALAPPHPQFPTTTRPLRDSVGAAAYWVDDGDVCLDDLALAAALGGDIDLVGVVASSTARDEDAKGPHAASTSGLPHLHACLDLELDLDGIDFDDAVPDSEPAAASSTANDHPRRVTSAGGHKTWFEDGDFGSMPKPTAAMSMRDDGFRHYAEDDDDDDDNRTEAFFAEGDDDAAYEVMADNLLHCPTATASGANHRRGDAANYADVTTFGPLVDEVDDDDDETCDSWGDQQQMARRRAAGRAASTSDVVMGFVINDDSNDAAVSGAKASKKKKIADVDIKAGGAGGSLPPRPHKHNAKQKDNGHHKHKHANISRKAKSAWDIGVNDLPPKLLEGSKNAAEPPDSLALPFSAVADGDPRTKGPSSSDTTSLSSDGNGIAPPPPVSGWWTFERRATAMLFVCTATIVLILLYGVQTYNPRTVDIVCGAFVADALVVQSAYAALRYWWRMRGSTNALPSA